MLMGPSLSVPGTVYYTRLTPEEICRWYISTL